MDSAGFARRALLGACFEAVRPPLWDAPCAARHREYSTGSHQERARAPPEQKAEVTFLWNLNRPQQLENPRFIKFLNSPNEEEQRSIQQIRAQRPINGIYQSGWDAPAGAQLSKKQPVITARHQPVCSLSGSSRVVPAAGAAASRADGPESERGAQLGGGHGRNAHGSQVAHARSTSPDAVLYQCDRSSVLHRRDRLSEL